MALAASAWSVPGAAVDDRRAHPATPTAAGPTGGQPPAMFRTERIGEIGGCLAGGAAADPARSQPANHPHRGLA
ncbi:hypothetical protein GCM10020218_068170 [Dactylosporangium vinaceum]